MFSFTSGAEREHDTLAPTFFALPLLLSHL